jgi:hypothetical protein
MHLDISQESFYVEKCRAQKRDPDFVTLRNLNALGHFTRAILCGNWQENHWGAKVRRNFERACAAEMPVDIAQKLFYAAIYRTNDRAQTEL